MSTQIASWIKILFGTLADIKEGINSVSLTNNENDQDINDILSDAKSRAEFNEKVQKLKDNKLKGISSEEKVEFSNGDKSITISL